MPEAYSLRLPENSNATPGRRVPLAKVKNHQRDYHPRTEVCDLSSDNNKGTPSDDFIKRDSPLFRRRPEFYHLSIEDTRAKIVTCRPPPEFISKKNRKSSIPRRQSSWNKSEMCYISTEDRKTSNDNRQSPYTNNNHRLLTSATYLTPPDSPSDTKVTVYLLTTSNEGAFRSFSSPSPSPPLKAATKSHNVTFLTAHGDTTVAKLGTKAAESIQRSMNKYRFYGY